MVRASGRSFSAYHDRLSWPARELRMILKNRSPAFSITDEDIRELTDRFEVVYVVGEPERHGVRHGHRGWAQYRPVSVSSQMIPGTAVIGPAARWPCVPGRRWLRPRPGDGLGAHSLVSTGDLREESDDRS